ncbi:MAG: Rieske 2Fe-2S domain-containing protein [Phaeodactylibacter sp.]|nr:Rieske 2Fe-2S domain-containing protein [Phaeodactylibacter sp.]MCB9263599.1 Rieske 2Fe-2S domain-containing protein [Lewinellaceae bacterium]MCB9287521.1 Rieske 2Fe-2S domain-containing protein [Lewinellaceae bacterium]
MKPFRIDPDIRKASALPAAFYEYPSFFEQSREKVFASTWQYAADVAVLNGQVNAYPFTLLPGVLDEPLVLTSEAGGLAHCLSNVCTHRGKVIVEKPAKVGQLTCGYHGRCFALDGAFKRMPAFQEVEGFPSEADHLARISLEEWLGLYFVSLNPFADFELITRPIRERIAWMPLDTLEFVEEGSAGHNVQAHWALYCDNYLEGFHVPFVHPALNESIDFGNYDYELFPYCNLQIGIAREGEPCFDIPEGHPDHSRRIYAYYFWLFPNLMFNFYPWGLSLNVVEPLGPARTRVRFRTYAFRGQAHRRAANNIDQTELEDEAVVESVQLGIRSRYYRQGRFSPKMEKCVHHFHQLLDRFME